MDDILIDIKAESEYITRTLDALEEALSRDDLTIVELTAIASFIQNIYGGIENLLKRTLVFHGIPVPSTLSSHKDLLLTAYNNKMISEGLYKDLDVYRAFRHFHIHGYGIQIVPGKLLPLAENIPDVWYKFESELMRNIRPPTKKKKNARSKKKNK